MTPLVLDPRNRWVDTRTLLTPTGRLLRLTAQGATAVRAGRPVLRQRLLDAGAAHPAPPPRPAGDVTVVIPVRDRAAALDRCLASLGGHDVLVVDDGSADPVAVRRVCERHGARYLHRSNGGPAAARNTALPLLDRDIVAFLDSDCVAPPEWLEQLRGHFDDAAVAAVAPRITGGPRSPLDLGPHPAAVRPGSAVAYVPTAALLVRRSALAHGFDEALRYGEDVDLVWRLVDEGWTVRYDPRVVVTHEERDRLARRFRYGTSAAPLSSRHPGKLTHLVLPPWPTAVLALLLARRPLLAAATAAVATVRLDATVRHRPTSARLVAASTTGTAFGLGRAVALTGPLGWWAAAKNPRFAVLLLAPAVHEWCQRDRPEPVVPFVLRYLSDQAAYGAGVLVGCVTHRTTGPLRPRTRTSGGRGEL